MKKDFWSFLKGTWWVLLIIVGLRLTLLTHHPVVNDEALYVEYMQQQKSDFDQYKWISIDNENNDWKPPLQYWIGSRFVDMFQNPMAGPRFMHGMISVIGYVFLLFLLFRITGSIYFVNITGILFAFSPTYSVQDKLVLTDSLVYGFGYVVLWLVYELFGVFLKKGFWLIKVLGSLFLIFAMRVLMFTKQTGELFAIYPIVLIILILYKNFKADTYFAWLKNIKVWKLGVILSSFYIFFWFLARLLYRLSFPDGLYAGKDAFTQYTGYAFSLKEILTDFPISIWIDNLIQGFKHDYFIVYGVPTMLAILISIVIFVFIKKRKHGVLFLGICWLMVASTYVILVKKFSVQGNKFMLYTGIVNLIFWGYVLSELFGVFFKKKRMLYSVLALGLVIPHWIWNMSYYTILPHSMTEVIGTYSSHCVKFETCNWGFHAQINDLIGFFQNRDIAQKESIVFVDPTWGMPGTVISIHQRLFPSQKIMGKIETGMVLDFHNYLDNLIKQNPDKEIVWVFDGLASRDWGVYDDPDWLKKFANSDYCSNKIVRDKLKMPQTNFTVCTRNQND